MWTEYFSKIKDVCPWSWEAWKNNKIYITHLYEILPLNEYEAIVYIVDEIDEDSLDEYVESLNEQYAQYEFLWSHPTHTKGGKNQTPIAVVIQQDRKILESLRKGTKDGIDSKTEKIT
tara:strand:+ start:262 stop:615 length:354 start_codon:yes stop_codon:yes gene_type:complete